MICNLQMLLNVEGVPNKFDLHYLAASGKKSEDIQQQIISTANPLKLNYNIAIISIKFQPEDISVNYSKLLLNH